MASQLPENYYYELIARIRRKGLNWQKNLHCFIDSFEITLYGNTLDQQK